jgi:hypothetical protein
MNRALEFGPRIFPSAATNNKSAGYAKQRGVRACEPSGATGCTLLRTGMSAVRTLGRSRFMVSIHTVFSDWRLSMNLCSE